VGRKIGIVLDLDDAQQRRRSSEMVTGILQTLEDAPENERAQLFTREAARSETNGYEDAINDLYNEGVAVVIGGFDPAPALELINRARPRGVAVITLARVSGSVHYDRAFFVETSDTAALELWRQHSKAEPNNSVLVTDVNPFCGEDTPAPFDVWQTSHVERAYFSAGASCAEKFGYAAVQAARLPEIWLGPKAFASVAAWQSVHPAGAVMFAPVVDDAQHDPSIEVWKQRFTRLPYYYEALGHDITALITVALRKVSSDGPSNNAARAEALGRVSQGLEQAHARLWSSNSQGFTVDHTLTPTFAIMSTEALFRDKPDRAEP
jgi:hypothetical protein